MIRLRTTDYGRGGSRNCGFTELRKLSFALLRQTTRQQDNETTSGAVAGIMELRIYGSFAKTTSRAAVFRCLLSVDHSPKNKEPCEQNPIVFKMFKGNF